MPQFKPSANLSAALLLSALACARGSELELPSAREVLRVTGAGRSRAYELKNELLEFATGLEQPPGRPAAQTVNHENAPESERLRVSA